MGRPAPGVGRARGSRACTVDGTGAPRFDPMGVPQTVVSCCTKPGYTSMCEECGAPVEGEQSCRDRFHELLAAEVENEELDRMHGLTVLTYHLQHPSLTKPWYQITGAEVMRRVFGQGEAWQSVLLEDHPRGVGRRRSAATIARRKDAGSQTMPDWVVNRPVPGELTVMSIALDAEAGQAVQIEAWARSVAVHRFPGIGK